jgi:hypothetical protein
MSTFKFGLTSTSGSQVLSLGGAPTTSDNFTVFDLTTINTVNDQATAKAVLLSTVDVTQYELGFYIGIRWQEATSRSYQVGTGNGGATINDKYTLLYTTWYTVISTGDNLQFEYEDVSN